MKKPHYAWIVLGITFVVLLTSAAIRATPGVMIVPLEKEFGWSRAMISVAISVNLLLYGLIGLGALATITMKHPWQLIALWGVVVGCGTGIIAIVLGATVVQRWFYLHR